MIVSSALRTVTCSTGSDAASKSPIVTTTGDSLLTPRSNNFTKTSAHASDRFEFRAANNLLIFRLLKVPVAGQPRKMFPAHTNKLGPTRACDGDPADPRIDCPHHIHVASEGHLLDDESFNGDSGGQPNDIADLNNDQSATPRFI